MAHFMLKNLLSLIKRGPDGETLARAQNKSDYAQIDLLARFVEPQPLHSPLDQQRWSRVLPQEYGVMLKTLQERGWLAKQGDSYQVTDVGMPFVRLYQDRLAREKAEVMPGVRAALVAKDTSTALDLRRAYEARQPLGQAQWSGPEPQMSHSALTRRILFLDAAKFLPGISPTAASWLKLYAAEQHLWGAYWRVAEEDLPTDVRGDLATEEMDAASAAYWRAYQLALYVDNQETWQRCSGGDHVRRLELVGPDDGEPLCGACQELAGQQFLVARVPALPLVTCTCLHGCRLRYEPVLEMYDDLPG